MKRYFAHYIFIYPDWHLKYCIVEMDADNTIRIIYPYEQEIEKTSFFQGLLSFYPDGIKYSSDLTFDFTIFNKIEKPLLFNSIKSYQVFHNGRPIN